MSDFIDNTTGGEGVLHLYDTLEEADLVGSVRVEWRAAHEHFVNEHSECPVVNTLIMTLGENDLWGKLLRRTAKSVCFIHHNLSETQIHKYAVTRSVNKNVLGLQITIGNVPVVQVAQ